MPLPNLKDLTLVSYDNKKILTLTDRLMFLDRPLDHKFMIISSKEDMLFDKRHKDFVTTPMDYYVSLAAGRLVNQKEGFYDNLFSIMKMQKTKYSAVYWYLNTCFTIEKAIFTAPVLEYPNLLVCVSEKVPELSIANNNLKLEYTFE